MIWIGKTPKMYYLFPSYFIKVTVYNLIFHDVYRKFKPRYTLSKEKAIVIKHHWKNLYPEIHKPAGIFHLLDLDFCLTYIILWSYYKHISIHYITNLTVLKYNCIIISNITFYQFTTEIVLFRNLVNFNGRNS